MRGSKRRVAAVPTAAGKTQPAVNDGILDVANRKGVRCCVECGATSTPQWREGPMGPKTLCNACGVRRQRMLRKQQATAVASLPTAPVAAVQARRRLATRAVAQATSMPTEDSHMDGTASASEHSSDDTELDWAANAHPAIHYRCNQQPQPSQPQHQLPHELEESCNEEESAAYDLLFFAGVGGCGSQGGQTGPEGLEEEDDAAPVPWRTSDHHHGHNTRRHVHPVRRSDDFYYYGDVPEEPAASGGGGGTGGGSNKRRKLAVATTTPGHRLRQQRPMLTGPSFSSSEDAVDSKLHFVRSASIPAARTYDLLRGFLPAAPSASDLLQPQPPQQSYPLSGIDAQPSDQPMLPAASAATPGATPGSLTYSGAGASPTENTTPAPTTGASTGACTAAAAAAAAAVMPFSPYANPFFAVPMGMPVLPLSLPPVSARDLEVLAHIQREFQRACLQMHHANAACGAVGAVVAEQREAAANAREAAAAASQQLAAEVRAMADQYRLRDVLAELHSATAAAGQVTEVEGQAGAATATKSPAPAPPAEGADASAGDTKQ